MFYKFQKTIRKRFRKLWAANKYCKFFSLILLIFCFLKFLKTKQQFSKFCGTRKRLLYASVHDYDMCSKIKKSLSFFFSAGPHLMSFKNKQRNIKKSTENLLKKFTFKNVIFFQIYFYIIY